MRLYTANLVATCSRACKPAVVATLHGVYDQRAASSGRPIRQAPDSVTDRLPEFWAVERTRAGRGTNRQPQSLHGRSISSVFVQGLLTDRPTRRHGEPEGL